MVFLILLFFAMQKATAVASSPEPVQLPGRDEREGEEKKPERTAKREKEGGTHRREALPGEPLVGWKWRWLPQLPSLWLCFFLCLVAQNHSTLDSSGFHDLRGLGGHLAVPEAPRGFTAAAKCLESVGKWPFCRRGQLLEAGRKQKQVVFCRSLLQLLTESHSTFGTCSECFYFRCPNFSGFREILLSRKEVV